MRKSIGLFLLVFGIASGDFRAFGTPGDSIMVGTVYNLFHEEFETDEAFFEQVDQDLSGMVDAGLTHVMLFPMSQWDPETRSLLWKRTDYLIEKIEKLGLKFVPLMLKEEQCSHYFPIWMFDEIEGLRAERERNVDGPNNRENVDFADPRIWPHVENYFKAVIERYGNSPALSFYNVWNEPHYKSVAPHVVERFRIWLKSKYDNLPAVNRAWGEDYNQWSQVSPFLNDDWNSSMPGIDWRLFRNEMNAILLEELGTTLRRYDDTRPINANPVGTPFAGGQEFGFYAADNWLLTPHNDFNGVSYYPDGWDRENWPTPHPLWLHNLNFNIFRCASGDKGYILTELYTNAKNGLTLGGYLDNRTASTLAWIALANDCKGLLYWKWRPFNRGRQSLGRGLSRVDGTLAERGEAVRDIAQVMKREGRRLQEAHPEPAQVAQIIDMVGILKAQFQGLDDRTRHFPLESHKGIFMALDRANIPSDTLRADLGITLDDLKRYKLIVLPFQIAMRRELAQDLATYVAEGGTLIADARTATIDELDFAYATSPGGGLDEVFGARRIDWVGTTSWSNVILDNSLEGFPTSFEGKFFREQLAVDEDAQVVGRFESGGDPALVKHKYGKGVAYLAAVPLGASIRDEENANGAAATVLAVAQASGVLPSSALEGIESGTVSVKVHRRAIGENQTERILYVISGSEKRQRGNLRIPRDEIANAEVRSLIEDAALGFSVDADDFVIPIDIEPRGVRVILVSEKP